MTNDRTDEQIADAVEEAIGRAYTVREFIQVARDAWTQSLRDQMKHDSNEFEKALRVGVL